MQSERKPHPLIGRLWSDHKAGNLSRREFFRLAALLGLSVTVPQLFHPAAPAQALGAVYGQKLRVAGLLPETAHPAETISTPAGQVLR
ncbi:MAG: hypothetical protein JRE21_03010, partial [Deltaproteobacteria bacterium]|nr:hypothetical protein [Deltaproteobacteria bacterium]